MNHQLAVIKGIHPGFFLERELRKRGLPKGRFAISLQEYPQTLVSITKGKRRMNPALAIKIEQELGLEEGFLMVLQVYYDIRKEKEKQSTRTPDMSKIRSVLFWDTDIHRIKWDLQKRPVIQRVFERGNDAEKAEIIRFYGQDTVDRILKVKSPQKRARPE